MTGVSQGLSRVPRKDIVPVPMSVGVVDAIVGVNTHRDGLLAWIVTHALGPRLAVRDQATNSYAAGLGRVGRSALSARERELRLC
jgi:hypothetical protein